jgi:hypothetical protein
VAVRIAALCGILILAGCTTCYERETTAAHDFDQSFADCEAKEKAAGAGSTISFAGRDEFMESCMKEHGWRVKPRNA